MSASHDCHSRLHCLLNKFTDSVTNCHSTMKGCYPRLLIYSKLSYSVDLLNFCNKVSPFKWWLFQPYVGVLGATEAVCIKTTSNVLLHFYTFVESRVDAKNWLGRAGKVASVIKASWRAPLFSYLLFLSKSTFLKHNIHPSSHPLMYLH